MWNLERSHNGTVFNLVDLNSNKSDELVSSASFNGFGSSCVFLYTTSKGMINICDFREKSNFTNRPSQQLSTALANKGQNDQYNRLLDYVSSALFLNDANQVVSRDYLSVKLWDLRSSANYKPLFSAQVTDYMEKNLSTLYEQDSLDDEFFLDVSPDGKHMVTGGYNKSAHIIDMSATSNTVVQCKFSEKRGSNAGKLKVYNNQK